MENLQLLLHEVDEGVLLFAVSGEIDMATEPTLREAARTAIDSGQYRRLVFDLTRCGFIDSTGLHALVDAQRGMTEVGGDIRVVNSSHGIQRVLELTGLDRFLNVVPDREAALALVA